MNSRLAICYSVGLLLLLGTLAAPVAQGEALPPDPPLDYSRLLRELKPRMLLEFAEQNLNAYLRAHPQDFAIPDGFDAPAVAFRDGVIEVSAVTKLLFLPTRVRVSTIPEVVRGRLRLRVHKIHAGPIPLPPSFHRGTADTVESVINQILANNDMELLHVEIVPKLVRVTAQVRAQ